MRAIIAAASISLFFGLSALAADAPVKKSNTGICHAPGTTYYDRTKNFTPFRTLEECLKSGGRLPKK